MLLAASLAVGLSMTPSLLSWLVVLVAAAQCVAAVVAVVAVVAHT